MNIRQPMIAGIFSSRIISQRVSFGVLKPDSSSDDLAAEFLQKIKDIRQNKKKSLESLFQDPQYRLLDRHYCKPYLQALIAQHESRRENKVFGEAEKKQHKITYLAMQKAVELFEGMPGQIVPMDICLEIGKCYTWLMNNSKKTEQKIQYAEAAVFLYSKFPNNTPALSRNACIWQELAEIYQDRYQLKCDKDPKNAEIALQQAINYLQKANRNLHKLQSFKDSSPCIVGAAYYDLADNYGNLGQFLYEQKNYTKAYKYYDMALNYLEKLQALKKKAKVKYVHRESFLELKETILKNYIQDLTDTHNSFDPKVIALQKALLKTRRTMRRYGILPSSKPNDGAAGVAS